MAFHTSLHLYTLFLPCGMLFCFVPLKAFLLFRCHIFWIGFLVITNGNFVLNTFRPSNSPRFTFIQPQSNLFILISPGQEVRSKAQVPSPGVGEGGGGGGNRGHGKSCFTLCRISIPITLTVLNACCLKNTPVIPTWTPRNIVYWKVQ